MAIPNLIAMICPSNEIKTETVYEQELLEKIRLWLIGFMVLLVLSGITAFPVQRELHLLIRPDIFSLDDIFPGYFRFWLLNLNFAIDEVVLKYPYLLYGYDWLAYSHIVIALFFIGVYRNPIQNAWVLRIGMIACIGVFILATICGQIRGIPFFWTLIDCSFGFFGIIPLIVAERFINRLKKTNSSNTIESIHL